MPVLLCTSADLSGAPRFDSWLATTGSAPALPRETRLADLAGRFEAAFDAIREEWWALAREIGRDHPSAIWSHAAAAGTYGSDFGLMLAWARLAADCAGAAPTTMVVCDDPWLFRHIAGLKGVAAGRAPALWPTALKLAARGMAARLLGALRAAWTAIRLAHTARHADGTRAALIVYGHPESRPEGHDAYFGELMDTIPHLGRMLHTDCRLKAATRLAAGDKTASLYAYGRAGFALLALPWTRWRATPALLTGPKGWLIRRAMARENSGGGPAMTRWQMHCQENWLKSRRPDVVAWPWENHAWERALVRAAKVLGIRTVGYQHAVIGRHQFNFSPASNWDGLDSIPDRIACNGPAYRDQLRALGVPAERLVVAGAFRVKRIAAGKFDPAAPHYLALSAIPLVAARMMQAIRPLAEKGFRFVIKDHPLYPFTFTETEALKRTTTTVPETPAMAGVVYATGTPGLEGLMAGVPTFRLMLEDAIALDIMPDGVAAEAVTAETLEAALRAARAPAPLVWEKVMAPVAPETWQALLAPAG